MGGLNEMFAFWRGLEDEQDKEHPPDEETFKRDPSRPKNRKKRKSQKLARKANRRNK